MMMLVCLGYGRGLQPELSNPDPVPKLSANLAFFRSSVASIRKGGYYTNNIG
jgi:hypothetical protein